MEALLIIIIIVSLIVYFAPSIIAVHRKCVRTTAIVLVNLFLGWSLMGWFGAMIWAFVDEVKTDIEILDV